MIEDPPRQSTRGRWTRMDAAVDEADRLEVLLADGDVGADDLVRRLVELVAVVVVDR